MGIFNRKKVRNEALPPLSNDAAWADWLSARGYTVSSTTALQVSAVFRCVDLVSKTIATLPLHLFENTPEGRVKRREHPLYNILYVQPNRYTTAYEMWQMFVANLLLTRGGFLRIKRNGRGQVTALWNIPTCRVSGVHEMDNGQRYIIVSDGTKDGETETLLDDEFLYVPNFRYSDDLRPEDPMTIAADVLGLTSQLGAFARQGFQTTNPGGFIEHPGSMSDKAYERFKHDFERNYSGVMNAGRWLILEEGMKAAPWSRNMEGTQLLESRKWAVTEICRVFGVPPHLCMDMEHATFSNIEQQSMEYVRDCINPLCTHIEQSVYKDLLTEREKRTYFAKFNLGMLMRGDIQTRSSYYHMARNDGWMSANDIRELEDMNRIPAELGGDIYAVNGNMIPLYSIPANLPKGAIAQAKDNGGGVK